MISSDSPANPLQDARLPHARAARGDGRFFLPGLLLLKTAVQIWLYRRGLLSVAADEYARGILAARWAEHPRLDLLADIQGTWLPFEKYLNGLLLTVWPDVILAPRLTVFLASCIVLIVLYRLTQRLFADEVVAALTALLAAVLPWFAWLSGTPMLEMYFLAGLFAGLYCLVIWLQEFRRGYWALAGVCFLLASGFHVQSWPLINLVNLLTLPFLARFALRRDYRRLLQLIGFYLLGNGLILSFTLLEYAYTGHVFAFLASHTAYSTRFYGGYDVPLRQKLLYYPELIVQNASAAYWIGLPLGLLFIGRDAHRGWKLLPLLLALTSLLLHSVLNVFSGPASAAPGRYSLLYLLLLSPYAAYGIVRLARWGWGQTAVFKRWPAAAAAAALAGYLLLSGASRLADIPGGQPWDAVNAGRSLQRLLDQDPGGYLVELHYWEFLAVNLTAHHFDQIRFDREQNLFDRTTPSLFLLAPADACASLAAIPNLRYVALRDDALKLQAQQIRLLELVQQTGIWTIYRVTAAGAPCA